MKVKQILNLLLVISSYYGVYSEKNEKFYCKVAPLDGFANFGECAPRSNTVDYQIEVVPIVGPGIDLRSEVELVLYGGDDLQTVPVAISSPISGTVRSLTANLIDIGAPQQVGIFLKSDSRWKCLKITVYRDFRYWVFSCNGELSSNQKSIVFGVSGNKLYTATVMTGSVGDAGTKGGIEVSLVGDLGQTNKILLKQGFYSSTVRRIMFRAADVGSVKEISLLNTVKDDPWYCEFVRIQSEDGTSTDFTVRRWIGYPYSNSITITNKVIGSENSPAQDIDCNTRALDIVPQAPDDIMSLKVRCPLNCESERFATIIGSGIHAASSSICKSAIFDNILSPSGGELVLTITPNLPRYFGSKGAFMLESNDFFPQPGGELFGFYFYMSNSIDYIESEVRIVDSTGQLSNVGRLEIHRNNKWGAVLIAGEVTSTNDLAATLVCKELGYEHGSVLPSCNYVNGHNVCSPSGYPIVAAGLQCDGHEIDISQCSFEEPKSFNPSSVVAVQCSTNLPTKSEQGALRIVDSTGSLSRTSSGRLEIFLDGWGSICSDGFTKLSEAIACKQMGYSGIKDGGSSNESCKEFLGTNTCGKPEEPILAVDVKCSGNESKLIECQHYTSSDIYCVHEEDVVVSCDGGGDPTGHSIYEPEKLPKIEPKIPFKKFEFSCNNDVSSFNGAAGDGLIVVCPAKCSNALTHVKGSYIYTEDTPVCKAAIHAGILDNENGGEVLVMFVLAQSEYYGTYKNGIQSYGSILSTSGIRGSAPTRAITISKVTSSLKEGSLLYLVDDVKKIDLPVLPYATLSWVSPPDFQGFRGDMNDYVDASNLPGGERLSALDDFTIATRILISGGEGTWRTILAHTECLGMSMYIDRDNSLHFDQLCNKDTVSTSTRLPLNEWIFLAIAYRFSDRRVTIYVNGNKVEDKETDFTFNLRTKLIIGRSSDSDSEYFLGHINNLNIWDVYFDEDQVRSAMEKSWHERTGFGGGELKNQRYTTDGRVCISPCKHDYPVSYKLGGLNYATNSAIKITCDTTLENSKFDKNLSKIRLSCPSNCISSKLIVKGNKVYSPNSPICKSAIHMGVIGPSGGEFILSLYPGLKSYIGASGKNGVVSLDEKKYYKNSFTLGVAPAPRLLNCYDNASFLFQLPVGEKELLVCPGDCALETKAKVYGMDLYSPISSVCRAAIHAAKLPANGGEVQIEVVPEQFHFEQSNRNGIQSESTGYYIRSFKFI